MTINRVERFVHFVSALYLLQLMPDWPVCLLHI